MKTSDVPHLRSTAVADAKETARKTTADKDVSEHKPADTRFASTGSGSPQAGSTSLPLTGGTPRAAESGDPEVHQALAVLQAAQQNRDALGPPAKEAVEAADEDVKKAKDRLADLGYPQD